MEESPCSSKKRSVTPELKPQPNYKISIQPISPGISPIKKPKFHKTKKDITWKSKDLEKVKTEVNATNLNFIAKHKIKNPTKKPAKLEFMIKQCLFVDKHLKFEKIKNCKDQFICITKDKTFKLDKCIDFKAFELILENWGFKDNENYSFEYSKIDINLKNIIFVVRLVERSVQNYDLEDARKTFRYLYCLLLDPASSDCIHTSSAMKATYLRLKNFVSDEEIVSTITRGKVPPEIAVNVLSCLNDFDAEFLLLYAISVSPLDSSLDFLEYLNNCDPEYYEMYLVYYVFERTDKEYSVEVLKIMYAKLKQMQYMSPAILYSKFREECWERLKPNLNVFEKKDLF